MKLRSWHLLLLSALMISGCSLKQMASAVVKVGQVVWDPSVQVGGPDDQATQIALSMYAAPTANPNPNSIAPEEEKPELSLTITAQSEEEMRAQILAALAAYDQTPAATPNSAATTNHGITISHIVRWMPPRQAAGQPATTSVAPTTTLTPEQIAALSPANPAIRMTIGYAPASPLPPIWHTGSGTAPIPPEQTGPVPSPQVSTANSGDNAIIWASPSGISASQEQPRQLGEYASSQPAPLVVTPSGPYGSGQSTQDGEDGTPPYTAEYARAIATPVSFKILQLKDDSLFLSADQDSLTKDMRAALGSTYIDSEDYILQPGQFKFIPPQEINKNTRFIAVYAQFHEMDGATWKSIVPVAPKGRGYNLFVWFDNNTVILQQEGSR